MLLGSVAGNGKHNKNPSAVFLQKINHLRISSWEFKDLLLRLCTDLKTCALNPSCAKQVSDYTDSAEASNYQNKWQTLKVDTPQIKTQQASQTFLLCRK